VKGQYEYIDKTSGPILLKLTGQHTPPVFNGQNVPHREEHPYGRGRIRDRYLSPRDRVSVGHQNQCGCRSDGRLGTCLPDVHVGYRHPRRINLSISVTGLKPVTNGPSRIVRKGSDGKPVSRVSSNMQTKTRFFFRIVSNREL